MAGIEETSSNLGRKGAKWKFGTVFTRIDGFGADVPSFNLKGETKVNTIFGGIVTAFILLLTLGYSILKAVQLNIKHADDFELAGMVLSFGAIIIIAIARGNN